MRDIEFNEHQDSSTETSKLENNRNLWQFAFAGVGAAITLFAFIFNIFDITNEYADVTRGLLLVGVVVLAIGLLILLLSLQGKTISSKRNNVVPAILLICFFLMAFTVAIVKLVGTWTERDETYVSPQKSNVIIVRYDMASRPTVYKKKLIGKEKLWTYDGTGFTEEVFFNVKWASENQIIISYTDGRNQKYNEEHEIDIP